MSQLFRDNTLEQMLEYDNSRIQQQVQYSVNSDCNSQQFFSQMQQTLQNDTIQKMIDKFHKERGKVFKLQISQIPLEILNLTKFYSFHAFNVVQSQCATQLLFSNTNTLICAPTASGKTVIMEMAVFRELGTRGYSHYKILYLAPIRALCQQKVEEWTARFSSINLTVSELTGDNDYSTKQFQIKGPHLIVATPEKWDSHIRRQKNVVEVLSQYSLILLDEIHCVGDIERGSILECVVTRIKSFSQLYKSKLKLRIVAVSATLPNIEDIAVWLKVKKGEGLLQFKESDRTVPLEKHVLPYNCENQYSFENYLNYRLLGVIEKFSENKPTLVFCQTQKGTQVACQTLLSQGKPNQFIRDDQHAERLITTAQSVQDKQLVNFIKQGIGFHNANLVPHDRMIVEKLFLSNDLPVICTTTTLALGVNLPAHLVVIKSTLCYKGQALSYQEYSLYELSQMMGRAGRPQFDDKGVVVVMTEQKKFQYYKKIFEENQDYQNCPPLESYLGDNLNTILNSEIAIGYITSVESMLFFIRNSYYYVRQMVIQKALFENMEQFQAQIDKIITEKCQAAINQLSKLTLIRYDERVQTMESTDFGKELARQNLQVQTMERVEDHRQKHPQSSVQDVLSLLVYAKEFQEHKPKQGEKADLSKLNKLTKWKLKGAINTPPKKIFVFIQAHIANLQMEWELKRQVNDIVFLCTRILKCFKKYFQTKGAASGYISSLRLLSYIENKTWPDDIKSLFCQFQGIGDKTAAELVKNGYRNLEQLMETNPEQISEQLKKPLAFCMSLVASIKNNPTIQSIRVQSVSASAFDILINVSYVDEKSNFIVIISICDKLIYAKKQQSTEVKYQHKNDMNDVYFEFKISLINLKLVGLNKFYILKVRSYQGRAEVLEMRLNSMEEVLTPSSNIDLDNEQKIKEQTTVQIKKEEESLNTSTIDRFVSRKTQQPELEKNSSPSPLDGNEAVESLFNMDLEFSFLKIQQDSTETNMVTPKKPSQQATPRLIQKIDNQGLIPNFNGQQPIESFQQYPTNEIIERDKYHIPQFNQLKTIQVVQQRSVQENGPLKSVQNTVSAEISRVGIKNPIDNQRQSGKFLENLNKPTNQDKENENRLKKLKQRHVEQSNQKVMNLLDTSEEICEYIPRRQFGGVKGIVQQGPKQVDSIKQTLTNIDSFAIQRPTQYQTGRQNTAAPLNYAPQFQESFNEDHMDLLQPKNYNHRQQYQQSNYESVSRLQNSRLGPQYIYCQQNQIDNDQEVYGQNPRYQSLKDKDYQYLQNNYPNRNLHQRPQNMLISTNNFNFQPQQDSANLREPFLITHQESFNRRNPHISCFPCDQHTLYPSYPFQHNYAPYQQNYRYQINQNEYPFNLNLQQQIQYRHPQEQELNYFEPKTEFPYSKRRQYQHDCDYQETDAKNESLYYM